MLRRILIASAIAGITLAASPLAFAQKRTRAAAKTGYAPVNGLNLYYEIHGTGEPLVLVSRAFKRDGWYPEILAGMAQMNEAAAEPMKQTPMYQLYARLAPKPTDWLLLLTKLGELLGKDYDWSKDVAAIKSATLRVFGDADAVRTAHAVQFFELLGGGTKDGGGDGSGISNARLSILPGLTHFTICASPVLASTVNPSLDAPMPGKSRQATRRVKK